MASKPSVGGIVHNTDESRGDRSHIQPVRSQNLPSRCKDSGDVEAQAGQHSIRMFMKDYHNWSQWIRVDAASEAHTTATLKKSN